MAKNRNWAKVADELCHCGCKKSQHAGVLFEKGSGPCTNCSKCPRFTWKAFLDKDGKVLK